MSGGSAYSKLVAGIGLVAVLAAAYAGSKNARAPSRTYSEHSVSVVQTAPTGAASFLEAKQSPEVRQSYIDRIAGKYQPPIAGLAVRYDGSLDYYPNPLFGSRGMIMRTVFDVPAKSEGVVENPEIQVYRSAFQLQSEDEFLSSLVDHEYHHAGLLIGEVRMTIDPAMLPELNRRMLDVNGDLFQIHQELYAFSAQANAFQQRNLSASFQKEVVGSYNFYRKLVESKEQTPLTRWLLRTYPKMD